MGEAGENTELLLSLARIEGKLDVIDARIEALAQAGADHEGRLRKLEQRPVESHEARIADLEKRPVGITPRVFLSSLVGVATIVGSLGTVVTLAVSK